MEKEVVEGNKLIAEFMGKPLYDDKPAMPFSMRSAGLEYHSNWAWLMPVVEKISNYHYPNYHGNHEPIHPFEDCAYMRTFGMRDEEGNYMVRINASQLIKDKSLIIATWLAVVDFLTYYNQLSK